MDILHLDADEVEYLARVFAQAHERGVTVRVSVEPQGFMLAAGGGVWTPGMGTRQVLPVLSH